MQVAVAVVAAQAIVRQGMAAVLEGVADVTTMEELPHELLRFRAAVIHEDLLLPDMSRTLGGLTQSCAVLPLVSRMEPQRLAGTARRSPRGFLSLDEEAPELRLGVARVLAGGRYLPAAALEALSTEALSPTAVPALTRREMEVAMLAISGATARSIATSLHISESTAKTYLRRIYEKLDVPNRSAAIARLVALGLIALDQLS
jgi:DNA-binding NarL/FixJ family response regulator